MNIASPPSPLKLQQAMSLLERSDRTMLLFEAALKIDRSPMERRLFDTLCSLVHEVRQQLQQAKYCLNGRLLNDHTSA